MRRVLRRCSSRQMGGSACGLLIYVAMMAKKSLVHLILQRVLASAPDGSLVADTKLGTVLVFLLL